MADTSSVVIHITTWIKIILLHNFTTWVNRRI